MAEKVGLSRAAFAKSFFQVMVAHINDKDRHTEREHNERNIAAIHYAVGLYIVAAYWFTASTSFANPAVTIARSLSDTFAGIAPVGVMAFIVAQLVGMLAAVWLGRWLWPD